MVGKHYSTSRHPLAAIQTERRRLIVKINESKRVLHFYRGQKVKVYVLARGGL